MLTFKVHLRLTFSNIISFTSLKKVCLNEDGKNTLNTNASGKITDLLMDFPACLVVPIMWQIKNVRK